MASLFTQIDDVKIRGAFGVESPVPFYLQFVPGTVVDVISNPHSYNSYNHYSNINTITALPHITNGVKSTIKHRGLMS